MATRLSDFATWCRYMRASNAIAVPAEAPSPIVKQSHAWKPSSRRYKSSPCRAHSSGDFEISKREALLGGVSLASAALFQPSKASAGPAYQQIKALEETELGSTGLNVCAGGIGAWSWGDRSGYWGYNNGYTRTDNESAYKAIVENGIALVDTAEVYGFGLSEEILGSAIRESGVQPFVATKFAPLPNRFSSESVVRACRHCYICTQCLSFPSHPNAGFLTQGFSNDQFVMGLAKCAQQGLTQAVGVSNFRADRVRRASSLLEAEGQKLASNQVQYSLLYRVPETNGVVDALRETGSTLIAYSPLCQGLLTGKYTEDNLPGGARSGVINKDRVREVQPLLAVMREISSKRNKTLAQIAVNWTICKGALPIPGAKNAKQVKESAGAFGWRLSADEVEALDHESGKLKPGIANPVEKF